MIRYQLRCLNNHDFDGWFRSSAAYDEQAERGLLACAVCGTSKVEKAIMAPAVRSTEVEARPAAEGASQPATDIHQQMAASIPPEIVAKLREIREFVRKNADYVGPRFAEEARKIHYEEVDARGIYGEVTKDDVEALLSEGIDIAPLPILPDDRN